MSHLIPMKIDIEDVPVDEQTASFRQVRLIERESTSSEIVLGLQWYSPGGEPVRWTADQETHEVFYVSQGRISIDWEGPDTGRAELVAGNSFFLAPSRTYSVRASGAHPAFVVWALTPAPR